MARKDNWIVKNLLGGAIYIVAIAVIAVVGLGIITRHGQTTVAPDLTGMSLESAMEKALDAGVKVKVRDSVFIKRLDAGVVYRQQPKSGAKVKKGRSIFLTVNSIVPRKVVMPNLYGYPVSQAKAELKNRGLSIGRLNYVSDIASNNVLSQWCEGVEVPAGELVVSGSSIDLTVGMNRTENKTIVPNLYGMKYINAVDALHDYYLNLGKVSFDSNITSYTDTLGAWVYRQSVAAGTSRQYGTSVNLTLTLDESKLRPND